MLGDVNSLIREQVEEIQTRVGKGKAICACSGGVDSTTCAALANKAIGDQLTVIFIDTGFMREREPEQVVAMLKELGLKVELVQVADRFFDALTGVTEPTQQRLIFRTVFYQVFGEALKKVNASYLVQGTIKADTQEAEKGQEQHNVGIDFEKDFSLKVLEPVAALYKDEVRIVGRALGLPPEFTERMPFPGPGLLLRVARGQEITPEKVTLVRQATVIVEKLIKEIQTSPEQPFQAFPVLLPGKARGVLENNKRGFGHIMAIRVVDSKDALTTRPTILPFGLLLRIAGKITTEVKGVTRVLYEITPKPPATIEYN
ncbi:MAG: 7-cyano-7-deazaguanine synthase [Patescibacteria group bacterium]|nr:7-cyano-7-deazaguanine synthase [Patescibacteria group bacterium]